MLRIADGPDEVHLRRIARMEIKENAEKLQEITPFLMAPER